MNLEQIYREQKAYLTGHFLLSSGKHSAHYLQSARVLESPLLAARLIERLNGQIKMSGVEFDAVCSPALGGILAGYELARTAGRRFIFTERVNGEMTLRRGFEVARGERFIICEDVLTTGGSALESARIVEAFGGVVVGFAALANRGYCALYGSNQPPKPESKIPAGVPVFALGNFEFETYEAKKCPLCKGGSVAVKPGSRGN